MGQPRRYWLDAISKIQRESRCRVCGSREYVQAAHTIGRKHDELIEMDDGTVFRYVDADDVIPLCRECHSLYDRRELSILPIMTLDEQAAAVRLIGVERALHRLTGQMRVGVTTPG